MKVSVKKSKIAGKGLFATKDIKKGEIVISWHPKILMPKEYSQLPEPEHHYIIKDKGQILLMQPPERYVNHSCDPNTKPIERADVAIRDIKAGEEITSDYLEENETMFICHCGAINCRSKSKN